MRQTIIGGATRQPQPIGRRIFTVLLGTAVMLGLVAAAAAPAQAAASCRGGSCTGKDPAAMGCAAGAKTVREFTNVSLRVELRYSSRCRALWTRWTVKSSGMHFGDYVFIRRYSGGGRITEYRATTGINKGNQGWTKMIGRHKPNAQFRACNFIAQECTNPAWPKNPRATGAATADRALVGGVPATLATSPVAPTTTAAASSPTCEWVVRWDSAGVYELPRRDQDPKKVKHHGDHVGGGYCMREYNAREGEWYVSVTCSCADDRIGWMRRNALDPA